MLTRELLASYIDAGAGRIKADMAVIFIVLPESSDKEIIYRVEPWNSKEVDLPPFQ